MFLSVLGVLEANLAPARCKFFVPISQPSFKQRCEARMAGGVARQYNCTETRKSALAAVWWQIKVQHTCSISGSVQNVHFTCIMIGELQVFNIEHISPYPSSLYLGLTVPQLTERGRP